jgi:phage tail-like protein
MANQTYDTYPYNLPVTFHFNVDMGSDEGDDIRFQEVNGLTAEIGVEELVVGGENMFTYRLPVRAKYNNIILKRGMLKNSKLIDWFRNAVEHFQFEPRDIKINLLNEKNEPVAFWKVIQAYPVKWVISDFKASENALVIETIELAYQYFQRDPA